MTSYVARVAGLQKRLKKIDEKVAKMQTCSGCDSLELQPLKRERLGIKDEIARLEALFPANAA